MTDTFNPHTFHSRHPHLPRLILLALLALIVYLVWTETAAAEKRTLVVLSSDFQMKHYTAAGAIESEPAESEAACDSLRQGVSSAATSHPDLDVVTLPPLPADEQAAVDEHVALLNTIVDNIRFMAGTPGFKLDDDFGPQSVALHRYSMGDGLAFLLVELLGLVGDVAVTGHQRFEGKCPFGKNCRTRVSGIVTTGINTTSRIRSPNSKNFTDRSNTCAKA